MDSTDEAVPKHDRIIKWSLRFVFCSTMVTMVVISTALATTR